MPAEWALRRLTAGDAASVAALVRGVFAGLGLDPPPSALGETADSVAAQLAAGGGAGAWAGSALVGSVLWTEREGLYVGRLAVAPAWRRHGIARALLQDAEAEARSRGLTRLHLGTRLSLDANLRLFAACGFREYCRPPRPGYAEPVSADMEKSLAS